MREHRDTSGRFAPGHPGGPGRPRRAVEREYLGVLGDAVTLADWREVIARALVDAKAGDDKARAWLSKYLLTDEPAKLEHLAQDELRGVTVDDLVFEGAEKQNEHDALFGRHRTKATLADSTAGNGSDDSGVQGHGHESQEQAQGTSGSGETGQGIRNPPAAASGDAATHAEPAASRGD